jgi:hypothetical protein
MYSLLHRKNIPWNKCIHQSCPYCFMHYGINIQHSHQLNSRLKDSTFSGCHCFNQCIHCCIERQHLLRMPLFYALWNQCIPNMSHCCIERQHLLRCSECHCFMHYGIKLHRKTAPSRDAHYGINIFIRQYLTVLCIYGINIFFVA